MKPCRFFLSVFDPLSPSAQFHVLTPPCKPRLRRALSHELPCMTSPYLQRLHDSPSPSSFPPPSVVSPSFPSRIRSFLHFGCLLPTFFGLLPAYPFLPRTIHQSPSPPSTVLSFPLIRRILFFSPPPLEQTKALSDSFIVIAHRFRSCKWPLSLRSHSSQKEPYYDFLQGSNFCLSRLLPP